MRTREGLCVGVAAIAVAMFLTGATAQLRAQQSAPPGVTVGESDLGGVVTGPNGPEAGVWVIAETTDLPTQVREDRRHRRSGPLPDARSAEGELQRVGARLRPRRFAQGHDRARQDPQPHGGRRRRTRTRRREYYPADLLVLDAQGPGEERVPRHRTDGQRHRPRTSRPRREWLRHGQVRRLLRPAISSATRHTRRSRRSWATFAIAGGGVGAPHQSGQAGPQMANAIGRLGADRALKLFADWTDRIAAGELPPRSRRGRRASSATSSSRCGTGRIRRPICTTRSSTDRRNPTVNANGPIYGALEQSTDYLPGARSGDAHRRRQVKHAGARPEHAAVDARSRSQPSPYWGDEPIWDEQDQRPQSDARREGPRLDHRPRVAPARQSGLLQGGIEPSVGEAVSRSTASDASPGDVRPEDREAHATSAPASARTT